jgi:triosephosphate isomerase
MKAQITTPFFEIGVKNYLFGDAVFELAQAADRSAIEFDVSVLFIAPYVDIRRIAEHTEKLIVLAPYMDVIRPGRGLADILPEAIHAAGASGVVVNHSERPMSIGAVSATLARAKELDLLTFACADTIAETRALAQLGPDILNPEPSAKIGSSGGGVDLDFMRESVAAVRAIDPRILVEQAAGITTPDEVYRYIRAGADGVGVASGIAKSPIPQHTVREMISAVRNAIDDSSAENRSGKANPS